MSQGTLVEPGPVCIQRAAIMVADFWAENGIERQGLVDSLDPKDGRTGLDYIRTVIAEILGEMVPGRVDDIRRGDFYWNICMLGEALNTAFVLLTAAAATEGEESAAFSEAVHEVGMFIDLVCQRGEKDVMLAAVERRVRAFIVRTRPLIMELAEHMQAGEAITAETKVFDELMSKYM